MSQKSRTFAVGKQAKALWTAMRRCRQHPTTKNRTTHHEPCDFKRNFNLGIKWGGVGTPTF